MGDFLRRDFRGSSGGRARPGLICGFLLVGGERGSAEVAVGDDEVADAVGGEDDAETAFGEGLVGGVGAVALDEDEFVVGEAAGAGVAEEDSEREG